MTDAPTLLDGVFRRSHARLLAVLVKALGRAHLELAEESLQEAYAEAVRAWPLAGAPATPEAWLLRVARNRALDALRRARHEPPPMPSEPPPEREIVDDQLEMILLCAAPPLERADRVALTLQSVFGLTASDIGRAFRLPQATVAQRLVRAKRRVTAADFVVDVAGRLEAALDVLYVVFNEGYTVRDGEETLRRALAEDAIRTMRVVVGHPQGDRPEARALLALMLLQASRLRARVRDGELVPIAQQDRSLWERAMIDEAMRHAALAATGAALSDYHLLAGIALCHLEERVDWRRVLDLYDELVRRGGDGLLALNRAVALCEVHGPAKALEAVQGLDVEPYLLAAARGEFLRRLGRREARDQFEQARELAPTSAERRYFERQMTALP